MTEHFPSFSPPVVEESTEPIPDFVEAPAFPNPEEVARQMFANVKRGVSYNLPIAVEKAVIEGQLNPRKVGLSVGFPLFAELVFPDEQTTRTDFETWLRAEEASLQDDDDPLGKTQLMPAVQFQK